VAAEGEITVDALIGPNRSQKNAEPRQVAMYLLRHLTDASLPQIGDVLGGRDHSTVMYSIDKIQEKMKNDQKFSTRVKQIEARIQDQASAI
jgi:chromosomal replication initiator protein